MDLDEFRMILRKSGVDVWNFIDTAISVASLDYRDELKERRDGIVEKLYLPSNLSCRNCDNNDNEVLHRHSSPRVSNGGIQNRIVEKDFGNNHHHHHQEVDEGINKRVDSPYTPQSVDVDAFEGIFDDEQTRILDIKDHLEEPDQSEENLVHLLGSLADMDITFKALKETDIGRHVNRLRKNPSNEVRKLVKQLVRKWKELVDEWVKSNTPNGDGGGGGGGGSGGASTLIDEDSPVQNSHNQHKSNQNGHHHQVPDFAYSPNPNNGSSGSDKYNSEPERKVKTVPPRRDPPPKPSPHLSASSSAPIKQREQKVNLNDPKTLASATKRLQENYQEAQNAKKQRTIQVMNIHEIPKPKNSFFAKNKGGFQAKHW
ncbi:probable mediator of RNA polymerase II transcription subunit 26c [Papaver somniferum]|uniref:probable mediator of RNA polymerase II transcription subunit 26c n=1 Tax=Papaver somniferum TaxID=3469 RepID=UPI000E6F7826|nr:probable mediator of RNA polymerase II transcription subunit 26c [Papaver somniferum]